MFGKIMKGKQCMKMTKEECISRLEEITRHSFSSLYKYEIVVEDWVKDNKDRTYFAIIEKSIDTKISKHYVRKSYGYFDNVSHCYRPVKYGNLCDNFDFGGNSM